MTSDTRILVPHELFAPAESSYFEGNYELPILKAGPDIYEFNTALHWQITLTNTGDALLVSGTVEGQAKTSCARCLDTFEFPVTGEVEGYFLLSGEGEQPEDMEEDEFDVLPEDKTIDVAPLLTAAFLLDLPVIPLCNDDCKGLCASCGQNLNEGDCNCDSNPDTKESNPFTVLKDFPF